MRGKVTSYNTGNSENSICKLLKGDILITFNTHNSGVRHDYVMSKEVAAQLIIDIKKHLDYDLERRKEEGER